MMRQLVGVLLCVYVKRDILPKVSDVQSGLAAVGIMGMMVGLAIQNYLIVQGKQRWCGNSFQYL